MSAEAKFTSGPWKVVRESYGDSYAIFGAGRDELIANVIDYMPPKEVEANANLIVAAPELLELCVALVNVSNDATNEETLGEYTFNLLPLFKAAIVKAKGLANVG